VPGGRHPGRAGGAGDRPRLLAGGERLLAGVFDRLDRARLRLLDADWRGVRLHPGAQCRAPGPGAGAGARMNGIARRLRVGRAAATALGVVLAAGCAGTGRLAAPDASLPAAYAHAAPVGGAAAVAGRDGAWWTRFGDPALDALVADVLERNNDLAAAGLVLRRARLQARLAGADRWPRPSAGLDARVSRDEDGSRRSGGASLGVSWEADLFGRLDAAADA